MNPRRHRIKVRTDERRGLTFLLHVVEQTGWIPAQRVLHQEKVDLGVDPRAGSGTGTSQLF